MQKRIMLAIILMMAGGGAAQAFDMEDLEIHGFASTGYLRSTQNNYLLLSKEGSFEFNEAGLNVASSLTDNFRVGMQLFSRDQGEVGNNEVSVDWAFLDYQRNEAFGIRVGRIKTPLGLANETRDYDMLRASILLPQGTYNEYYREAAAAYQGAGLYGNVSLASAGRLRYDLYGGAMEVKTDGIMSKYIANVNMEVTSVNVDRMAGGQLRWHTPLRGLMLGSSFVQMRMRLDSESTLQPMYTTLKMPEMRFLYFSTGYTNGGWDLEAEYHQWKYDFSLDVDLSQLQQPNPPTLNDTVDREAYYVSLSYRFTDWLQTGAYYSVFYIDRRDHDGKGLVAQGSPDYAAWQKDLALSLRFDLSDYWLIKLETHFMDGYALCDYSDNSDGFKQNWMLFAVKTTVNF